MQCVLRLNSLVRPFPASSVSAALSLLAFAGTAYAVAHLPLLTFIAWPPCKVDIALTCQVHGACSNSMEVVAFWDFNQEIFTIL